MYEKITDKPFDLGDLNKTEARLALYFSCIIINNPDTAITLDVLMRSISLEELKVLDACVNECMSEWYHIPAPAKLEEGDNEEESEKKD
jgi:hypothetical protein